MDLSWRQKIKDKFRKREGVSDSCREPVGNVGSRKRAWTERKWWGHGQVPCSPFSTLLSTCELCGYFSLHFPHQWCWLERRWLVLNAGFVPEEIQPGAGQVVVRLGDVFGEKKQLYPDWEQGALTSCDLFLGWVGGWMVALLFLSFEVQNSACERQTYQSSMRGFLLSSHIMNRKVSSSQLSHSLWKLSSRRCWPKCQRGCF